MSGHPIFQMYCKLLCHASSNLYATLNEFDIFIPSPVCLENGLQDR